MADFRSRVGGRTTFGPFDSPPPDLSFDIGTHLYGITATILTPSQESMLRDAGAEFVEMDDGRQFTRVEGRWFVTEPR